MLGVEKTHEGWRLRCNRCAGERTKNLGVSRDQGEVGASAEGDRLPHGVTLRTRERIAEAQAQVDRSTLRGP